MHLPPVQPVSLSEIYVSGDVTIDDSAVVAPGTILQAAANSRIIIGPGVCLGVGVILNASQGALEIEGGAIIGSGVLIIGTGKIGRNACVGSLSTIFNSSVPSQSIVPAGSVITQQEPPTDLDQELSTSPWESEPEPLVSNQTPPSSPTNPESSVSDEPADKGPEAVEENPPTAPAVAVTTPSVETESNAESKQSPVVGQVYINQLLVTLFPERRAFNGGNPHKTSQSQDNKSQK